jgi:hypothetical protein
MALTDLIADAPLDEVAAFLDALEPDERWAVVSRLDRAQQRALYGKADPAIDLDHLVAGAGPLTEVIHDGMNTLPVARRFQKRFCRPGDGTAARLFGYNEGPTRRLIGPGYFVAVPDGPGVLVDYYQVPDGPVPPGWPTVVPNSKGLQRFVFHETRDRLRRVSAYVSVGAAYKRDRPLDHYFILCRRSG